MEPRRILTTLLLPLGLGLAAWATVATADLYTYVDAHGTRVYTDQRPSEGVSYRKVGVPGATPSASRARGQIFVYQAPNGERLVTNRRQNEEALTLIATYGRPTASVRCRLAADAVMPVGSGPFDAIIVEEAQARGLDPLLVKSVIWVESCFDQHAVSRVGAHGLMQLMPATAAELGVMDRFDPSQNIRGGVTYLARMLRRFDQNLDLALAAYNAGPGAVERHNGIPPFTETRNYVERVNAHYQHHAALARALNTHVAQD
jgi:soluble lytic murein transglycosylase-like protein